eukprot:10219286-Alexandrium_andersonii.AAC.1
MSASLVGSEMCIRDRVPPSWSQPRSQEPVSGSGGPPPTACGTAPSPGPAVSYTHLTLPTICSV